VDPTQQKLAAMMYAADRAVGDVLNALVAHGVDQNTVIVLTNDNGDPAPYENDPFRGGKGQLLEGGIRVPFLIKAPGISPGVYDRPITSLDVMPTFLALAGGDPNGIETDGVDVLPYLSGELSGDPHEVLHWRSSDHRFVVRRGDWKLTRPEGGGGSIRLYNLANDISERTNVVGQNPVIVQELLRELTYWEAQMAKPRWGSFGAATMNLFDHFVFGSTTGSAAWSTANQWRQVSGEIVTLKQEDGYANAVLEFRTSTADYVATNDMKRATLETFMLNELRFIGDYASAESHQATINGNDLLLVKSLDGQPPRITLEGIAAPDAGEFGFYLDNEVQLLDDLEIGGDGTQTLEIGGAIVDYYEPRGVRKTGTSQVRLAGNNTYSGDTVVEAGEFIIAQPSLADSADIRLLSGATLTLDFLGADIVDAFYVDGLSQLVGTWGAPGNPAADFHSQLISGDGVLYVTSAGLAGDFNGDGSVDAADYVIWRKWLGTIYDETHYDQWLANFGATVGAAASAVPEPAAWSLFLTGLLLAPRRHLRIGKLKNASCAGSNC
jgi:autotransporter-associated beta strand protein